MLFRSTGVGGAPHLSAQDEGPSLLGFLACPSSGLQDDQPVRKMLGDESIERKQSGTHSTLSFSPHLPQSHPYGRGVSHGPGRGVHCLLSCLWTNHPHPDDSPQESLVWIGQFLPPKPLQLFVVEEGLHPKIVVHPKSFELLSQGEICKNHVMDLSRSKSVFIKRRPDLLRLPVVQMGSPLQTS